MKRTYGNYQVGLKMMLWKGEEVLLLKTVHGKWDLPGGRIDNVEYETPLPKILAREVREELGPRLKYTLGRIAVQYHKYFRASRLAVFLTVYEAVYRG